MYSQDRKSDFGNVTKTLADGAYDTKDNFSYLYHGNIIPGIKTRRNSASGFHGKSDKKD